MLFRSKFKQVSEKISPKPVTFCLSHLKKSGGGYSSFAWPPVDVGRRVLDSEWKKELGDLYKKEKS